MKKHFLILFFVACSFNLFAQEQKPEPTFGRNIFSFSPVQKVANGYYSNYSGVFMNLAYERIFKNEHVAVKLPLSVSVNSPPYFYFMPALRFYPKKPGIVSFGFGPQLYFGTGNVKVKNLTRYNYYLQIDVADTTYTEKRIQSGTGLNLNLGITIPKGVYIEIEIGGMLAFYDSLFKDELLMPQYFGGSISSIFSAQGNLSFGYRF
ncbi:MAG: hypothetical protein ABI723_08620 [Bacteroidia bacterium]